VVWVGDKQAVQQQLANMYESLGLTDRNDFPFKFVINVEKMGG